MQLQFSFLVMQLQFRNFQNYSVMQPQFFFPGRAVRRVKEGTSPVLLQSGLDEKWWADFMECISSLRNFKISCLMGKLLLKDVLDNHLKDQSFRLVHWVEYHSITAKDQSRIHQFGKKVLPGLFLGYVLYVGGICKGDIMVADVEELETMDASEIYSKRLNAKEVIFPPKMENSYFQSQMDEKLLEEIRN